MLHLRNIGYVSQVVTLYSLGNTMVMCLGSPFVGFGLVLLCFGFRMLSFAQKASWEEAYEQDGLEASL